MFFGREDLILQLEGLWRKRVSSLVTCRGRRRIGKSTLIRQFAKATQSRFIKIEGARPDAGTTREDELRVFAEQLAAQTGCEDTTPSNWLNAFIRLAGRIRDDERTVVLLDEISWLGFGEPMFADIVRIAWENYLKPHDRLIVVLCGSVSSWVRENFIDNRAYVGRRSLDVVAGELPPRECARFWGEAASRTSARDILDVLSVTGGVPRYLEEIDPGLSADENIRRLAFLPKSVLRVDFDEMFSDVVTRQPKFAATAARALVDGPKSVTEIAAALGTEKSGRISSAMDELEEAGFVASDPGRNPETGGDGPVRGLADGPGAAVREPRHQQLPVAAAVAGAGAEPRLLGRPLPPDRLREIAEEGRPDRSPASDQDVLLPGRDQAAARDRAGNPRRDEGEGPPLRGTAGNVGADGARLRRTSRALRRGRRLFRRHCPVLPAPWPGLISLPPPVLRAGARVEILHWLDISPGAFW